MSDEISLNFFGSVARMPVDGALPICVAFGQRFYLTPNGFDKFNSPNNYSTAWVVKYRPNREVVDKAGNTSTKTDPKVNMTYKTFTLPMNYSCDQMDKVTTIKIPVTMYRLVPFEGYLGRTDVPLARGPHKDQVVINAVKPSIESKVLTKGTLENWKHAKRIFQ